MRLTNQHGTTVHAQGELAKALLSRGFKDADAKSEEKPKAPARRRSTTKKNEE